ncbi:hypothetical protein ACFU76_22495 [Streptomyces sp. NPDC057539]|uniref:hypothetical protein n=1 Tax=Streptomyces sp. NPDC057539 TaxID=3346159 RepID=UPI00369CC983
MDFSTETGASPELGRAIEGDFKTLLTVRADRPDQVACLHDWAAAQGLAVTLVVLDRGRTPSRPTLTLPGTGTLDEQRRAAERCAERLAAAGFPVVRTRLVAAPWNEGVPGTDAEAASLPAYCHFEHHVTLRLPIPYDTHRLAAVAERHSAHVSRAARRVPARGVQERSVTQRARGVGRPAARARLDALLDGLMVAGFQPADIEEEFVLHDDAPIPDEGLSQPRYRARE